MMPSRRTLLILTIFACTSSLAAESPWKITTPPAEWNLSPFYAKCIILGKFPVIASEQVDDYALYEAAYIVTSMTKERPGLLDALANERVRLVVMSYAERTTDVPEHSDLTPQEYWDRRARGLGATKARPAVSCAEENLLGFPGDPYHTENILVHEFAHALDEMSLRMIEAEHFTQLKSVYEAAKSEGLWKDTYAMTNPQEYWAEGVQSYFGTNRENDKEHNHVNTRAELKEYDPRLFKLIDTAFRGCDWQYVKPPDRTATDRDHLDGYNHENAPTFRWQAEEK